MEVRAKAKFVRMSPRKIRLVVDVVRGLKTDKALDQLRFIGKLAAKPVAKLLNSAIANANHNFELDKENLYIKEINVDEGAVYERWTPKAHGRATPIKKKTSHINLVLAEIKDSGKKEGKKQKIEKPIKLGEQPKKEKVEKLKENVKKSSNKNIIKQEAGKEIVDPRGEGRGKHTKIEGAGSKGFIGKVFRRKSG